MAPKIVRSVDGPASLMVALGCGAVAALAGYLVVPRVVHLTPHTDETVVATSEDPDDGGTPVRAQRPANSGSQPDPANTAEVEPAVAVRITRVDVQACGDGDELDTLGDRCPANPEVENILRRALNRLGDCPSALIAGQNPAQVLSIGLKVDFARRRLTAVQGRVSSVREPLTFVACAREALGAHDDLWAQTHEKARYLYMFAMRFGPINARGQQLLDAGTPTPVASETPTVQWTADAGAVDSRPILQGPCPVTPGTVDDPCPGYRVLPRLNNTDDPTLSQPVNVYMGGVALPHPETVSVTWSRALIRAEPRTGAVITRIPYNTRVTIEARSGSWYRVRWTNGFGWVFGEAIGRGGADAGASDSTP